MKSLREFKREEVKALLKKIAGEPRGQGSFYKYWTRSKTILLEREIGYLSKNIIRYGS